MHRPLLQVTGTTYGIFTSITGSAPNRIFNVEYRTAYYNSGGAGVPLNYEVRLYEGQTAFDVIYGTVPPTFTPPAARNLSVGAQRTNTTQFTLEGCDTTGGGSPPVARPNSITTRWVPAGQPRLQGRQPRPQGRQPQLRPRRHTNTDPGVHTGGRRFRRHHDVAWRGLGADQPQHDDRDNGMVPGK